MTCSSDMSYNGQQNVSPYCSESSTPVSSIIPHNSGHSSFTKARASSSPLQHHPVEARSLPLSSVSIISLPVTICSSTMTPLNKNTPSLPQAFFAQCDGDDDMQPLDLSIRSNRDEKTVKLPDVDEHKPVCMVKSCTCILSNTRSGNRSPCPGMRQEVTRSPIPGMTLASLKNVPVMTSSLNSADVPFYTQHQTQSSTYQASSSKGTSPSYTTQISTLNAATGSPFQLLVATDKVLNGVQNSSGLFRPYDDDMNQDMMATICDEKGQEPLVTPSKHDDDANDEPTYMDLDSPAPFNTVVKDHSGNMSSIYGKVSSSRQMPSVHNRLNDNKAGTISSLRQSPLLQALNSKKGHDLSDRRITPYFVSGVISHTSIEKSRKKVIGHTSGSSGSEQAAHPRHFLQQLHQVPDSSTIPASVPMSAGHVNMYRLQSDTHPSANFQYQHVEGHTSSSAPTSGQPLVSSSKPNQLEEPDRSISSGRGNSVSSEDDRSTPDKATASLSLPVSTNMAAENKHSRVGDSGDGHRVTTTEPEGNNSTKISLLDFWISKILMERSVETSQTRKPCNVDYICTANGEKRIRLRLVDLMEMQVEQSLKA